MTRADADRVAGAFAEQGIDRSNVAVRRLLRDGRRVGAVIFMPGFGGDLRGTAG